MITDDTTARAFVVNSLAARAQSVAEIESKLAAQGVPAAIVGTLVEEALALGYLDDRELAGQLARGHKARGYGRRRAATALRRRRISAADAEAVLGAAYGEVDEAVLAERALGSRPVADAAQQRRAAAFLVRRGFSPGVAWRVVHARRRGTENTDPEA